MPIVVSEDLQVLDFVLRERMTWVRYITREEYILFGWTRDIT